MQEVIGLEHPECRRCHSKNVYTLIDGTIVCRTCGNREAIINFPNKPTKQKRSALTG